MSRTSVALSNLRGFAIILVLAFHSFIGYLTNQPASTPAFDKPPFGWLANPIVSNERWIGFDLFCATQFVYLMHLMFFLSGLFVWPSLRRKGAKLYVYDRLLRLGAPFVLGVYLFMPVVYYPVYRVTALDPGWSAFWTHWLKLPFWPGGPLWFLWFLLALNAVAAALYWLVPRAGEFFGRLAGEAGRHPVRYLIGIVAASALVYVPLAMVWEPWEWVKLGPFGLQPSFAPIYAIYFFAGLAVGAHGFERGLLGADGQLVRRWGLWAAAAPLTFFLWIIPTALIVKGFGQDFTVVLRVIANLGFVLCSAPICLALIAVFLRFFHAPRPILGSLSENAYGIYFVHYLFVIWLQYLLLGIALFAIGKAAIVLAGTLIFSWAITIAVCRVPIGARLVGGKKPELAVAPAPATIRSRGAE